MNKAHMLRQTDEFFVLFLAVPKVEVKNESRLSETQPEVQEGSVLLVAAYNDSRAIKGRQET